MKTRVLGALSCLGLMLILAPAAQAAGDAAAGKEKSQTCLGCHGVADYTNVYPTYRVPKLGGQQAGYLEAALKAYRAGDRGHKTMQAQASSLSDQDIEDIAAYFASLGPQNK